MSADEPELSRRPFPNRASVQIQRKYDFAQPPSNLVVDLMCRGTRHRGGHLIQKGFEVFRCASGRRGLGVTGPLFAPRFAAQSVARHMQLVRGWRLPTKNRRTRNYYL